MATNNPRDWRELCKAAIVEQNPKEFMAIISTLLTTLEDLHEEPQQYTPIKSDPLATSDL